jgi:hypothetical protein
VLPRALFENQQPAQMDLHDVDVRLNVALTAAGYHEKSYYSVPEGFALVTRLEQINLDGTPKDPQARWSTEIPPLRGFSLREYVRALFAARAGFFRVIVFIVTSHPFVQSEEEISFSTASAWLRSGLNVLPASVGSKEFSPRHRTTVLIYEVEKIMGSHIVDMLLPGRLTGRAHLEKAGILIALEQ